MADRSIHKYFTAAFEEYCSREWGAQRRIADIAGFKPAYINDLCRGRKKRTPEETRRKIADAMGMTYEDVINRGREIIDKRGKFKKKVLKYESILKSQKKLLEPYKKGSVERYARIYEIAIKEVFGHESHGALIHFFSLDAIVAANPPGKMDYLNGFMDDSVLFETAVDYAKNMKSSISENSGGEGTLDGLDGNLFN